MTVKSGSHPIGPENGQLTINTYVGGMGAKMGHDLVLEAKRWNGTVNLDADNPAASSVQVTVDADSLEVVQATGGLKPLTDKDRADISQNQEKTLQYGKHPQITFQSTAVSGSAPKLSMQGNLTIAGNTKPVTLDVSVDDGPSGAKVTGVTKLQHSDFGVKPYSKMGALKVKDEVDIQVVVNLPSA
ncbi:MAG TPA: YceI family protein [Acidimicrobiales bacterium]|jgi:polyisoprenoid-binding protein YceI|nr:YceI family protein [Acidimicrobiales bacterium]